MGYETLSLSSMFETKCYRQNDRSDRVIISWFLWKSEFGMVLTSQIYVLYTKHNLPIFFIIDLFLCKWWNIQALLPLWSCRRRSFFSPKRCFLEKTTCHIWENATIPLDPASRAPWRRSWEGHCDSRALIYDACAQKQAARNSPVDPAATRGYPRLPAEVVSGTAARTPPPHAPGARMTWVKQTPSN